MYSPETKTSEKGGYIAYCRDSSAARLLRRLGGLTASGLSAGEQPPDEPPAEQIIRIPPDKIRPPEQGPPKPERSPEIRIPPERIKTPEDRIKIPPRRPPPDIGPPPAPEDRAKDGDE